MAMNAERRLKFQYVSKCVRMSENSRVGRKTPNKQKNKSIMLLCFMSTLFYGQ